MFSPIDLRWGITSKQLQEGQVINICLGTVEISRPFFVTCLGERYGWQRGPPVGEEGHDAMYQKQLDCGKENFPWIADYEDRAVTDRTKHKSRRTCAALTVAQKPQSKP